MFDIKKNWLTKFMKPILIIILILTFIFLFSLIYTSFSKETLPATVYRIAYDETWYPLELYDKEQDISVFSEEIVRAIAAEKHFSVQLVPVRSDDLLEGIERGEYEGVLSSLTLHEENAEKYISSDPYYLLGPVIVVSKSSHIKSLQDLNGKNIGIITGYKYLYSLNKYHSVNLVFYDYYNRSKLIEDVINQVIDGMILRMIPAYEYTKNGLFKDQLKVVSVPLNNDGLRLIVKNDIESKKLIEKFNEGLKAIKKNGIYSKLILKWELFDPEKT